MIVSLFPLILYKLAEHTGVDVSVYSHFPLLLNFHDDKNLTYKNNFGWFEIEKQKITCKRKIMNWLINLFFLLLWFESLFFFKFFSFFIGNFGIGGCDDVHVKVKIDLMVYTKE